jgi:diaminopimelate decarboxylase
MQAGTRDKQEVFLEDSYYYGEDGLRCEDVALSEIAESAGTPTYVYSYDALEKAYRELEEAFSGLDHMICYAVKANSNLSVLRALASFGAGADIVSSGELYRAMRAGFDPKKVVFAGVGKTEDELMAGFGERILALQRRVGLRAGAHRAPGHAPRQEGARRPARQPRRDPETHAHVSTGHGASKFGIPVDEALALAERVLEYRCIDLIGVHQHIGSQITKLAPYAESVEKSAQLVDELKRRGFDIKYFNIGRGWGYATRTKRRPAPKSSSTPFGRPWRPRDSGTKVLCEMGRYIAGNAGVLLTRVIYRKRSGGKNFIVADAGMNDLLRRASTMPTTRCAR